MKLLLTSAGLSNETLRNEFIKIVGKYPKDISVAFIITASVPEESKEFIEEDLRNLRKTGVENIKEIDISKDRKTWCESIKNSDVIWIEGGNTFYLLYWIRKSGLDKEIPELLKNKVYIGVSAGSIAAGPDIFYADWSVGGGDINTINLTDFTALSLVPFGLFPHFEDSFKSDLERLSKDVNFDIYAIDNNTAVSVNGKEMRFIGEGKYYKLN